ncbi:MAG: hypothetical protein ACM3PV_11345 [Betaproteobacteria bacterium]
MVAGVHHAQPERLPARPAGEDLEALGQPLRDQLEGLGLQRLQVCGRDAVGPRQRVDQALLGDVAELVEAGAETAAVEDLVLDGLLQLSVRDDPAIAQDASEYRQGAPP